MNNRRSLGQHFLISDSIAKEIVNFAQIEKDDIVLELGTGKGILIPHLCEKAKQVISIEKDTLLYLEAKRKFSAIPNLVLEQGDAFKTNHEFSIFVSNLPYSQSRKAIEWLLQRKFERAIIMVQEEFAQKLSLTEGKKERRAITVLASYCMNIRNLLRVRNTNFKPSPLVDSVVLEISQKKQISVDIVRAVHRLFSFRRKTLRQIGKQVGITIDSDKRLEDFSAREIMEIAKKTIG